MLEDGIIESEMGNLGDNLWFTPLFRSGKFHTLRFIKKDDFTEQTGSLFKGLAKIEFGGTSKHCPRSGERTHISQQLLNFFNIKDQSPLPSIILESEEINKAKELVSKYTNPVVVNFTTSNAGGDGASSRRVLSDELVKFIVDNLKKHNYTPINFGLSRNIKKYDGVENIVDLPLREAAACYAVIGKYVGSESGPPHLMLAVGGKIIVFHPDCDDSLYPCFQYHYTDEYFKNEKVRTSYINYKDYNLFEEKIKNLFNN